MVLENKSEKLNFCVNILISVLSSLLTFVLGITDMKNYKVIIRLKHLFVRAAQYSIRLKYSDVLI